MTTYTDTFGNSTLPPSEYGYSSLTLTGDVALVWPQNSNGGASVSKIMDITCDSGNTLTLPKANEVSTGEDFLIRNVGANTLVVKDNTGTQVSTVPAGAASYFYLTDNTTAAGVFGVIGYGVGTSSVDASSLIGAGIKAVGASLNQSHPTVSTSSPLTIDATHRAKLVAYTGGSGTFALTAAATLGDDFFVLFRNSGTGSVDINPYGTELIDSQSLLQIQPGESLMLICTGAAWYTVGYGRSTLYQFSQLVKDISAGGTITLTSAEVANKLLTFIGNPAGAVTINVPAVVAVYYVYSNISTAQDITFKTSSGFGVIIGQSARAIVLCDGTNIISAQSISAATSISIIDGSATAPSVNFASKSNTGLYKKGAQDLGVTVNGVEVASFGSGGLNLATALTVGEGGTGLGTVPAKAILVANSLDTLVALVTGAGQSIRRNAGDTAWEVYTPSDVTTTGAQTLTNKTIALGSNTVSGTIAQFNTACTDADFQIALVSGTSIKTINSVSLLGSGDIAVGDVTLAGAQTFTGTKTFAGIGETQYNLAGTDIAVGNGTVQYKTLAANTTFTESLADGQGVILMLNPSTFTTTWPTTTWIGTVASTAPTLIASVFNCLVFFQMNGVLYGRYVGRV